MLDDLMSQLSEKKGEMLDMPLTEGLDLEALGLGKLLEDGRFSTFADLLNNKAEVMRLFSDNPDMAQNLLSQVQGVMESCGIDMDLGADLNGILPTGGLFGGDD